MRTAAVLLLVALALSGCSDGGSSDDPAPSASASATSTGPPPPPVPTSDTLHLLAPPEMATLLPEGSSEVTTPATTGFGGPGGGQGPEPAEWRYVVTAATNVTGGEIHVWIEIVETLVQFPDPRPDMTCTWILRLELGEDNDAGVPCLTEPPGPIQPGIRELVFSFVAADPFELEANETVSVRFDRRAFSASPNNAVNVLSGSAEHDSYAQLRGLMEPAAEA